MFCACGCGNVWHVFYVCFLCLMLCLADCPCDTEDTCVRAAHHVKICETCLPISEDSHVAIVCWLHLVVLLATHVRQASPSYIHLRMH